MLTPALNDSSETDRADGIGLQVDGTHSTHPNLQNELTLSMPHLADTFLL